MVVSTEQKFAILSPTLGLREDFPSILLRKAFSPESENVIIRWGEVHRLRMRLKELLDNSNDKVQTPDANPIIKYHRHITSGGTEYLFGFTKAHAYLWSTALKAWQLKFTCASDCTHWSVISFNQKVLATNNVDLVQYWADATPGNSFADLDSVGNGLDLDGGTTYLTKAKYITEYENYVLLGFTQEGGTTFPYRVRWCTLKDETDWDESGTGDPGAKDISNSDFIKGFAKQGVTFEYLIVFQNHSIDRGWLVTGDEVFNWAPMISKVGLLATDAVVKDKKGNLYFLADDYSIHELKSGSISAPIDKTVKNINPSLVEYSCADFIDEYNQLQFSVPYGSGATGNNKVIIYALEGKEWSMADLAVRAFGDYSKQTTWTIDTWPYATIDSISQLTIDSVENVVGFPLDICSDYSGYTYDLHAAENDNGSSYTGKLVLVTDLAEKQGLAYYKRVSEMQHFFRREGTGTVLSSVKKDNEQNWEQIGSVSLTSDDGEEILQIDQSCDIRFRNLQLRFSATNLFRYLGTIFTFEFDGDR